MTDDTSTPPARWMLSPLGSAGGPAADTAHARTLRIYLNRLLATVDYLEFGDPSEYLTTAGVTGASRTRLSEVWTMPMAQHVALGAMRPGSAAAGVELPLSRILSNSDEPVQIVLGRPGSGKSTLCRYVAAKLATEVLSGGDRARIPIFVPVRNIDFSTTADSREPLIRAAVSNIGGLSAGLVDDVVALLDGLVDRAYFIVDGIDEAPLADDNRGEPLPLDRARVVAALADLIDGQTSAKALVTSRESDYLADPGSVLPFAFHYSIGNFNRDQVEESISKWHAAAAAAARATGRQLDQWPQRERALLELVRSDTDLGHLAEIPLLLNLMQVVFRLEADFPRNISQLASRAIRFLLIDSPRFRRYYGPALGGIMPEPGGTVLIDALRHLAYRITERGDGNLAFSTGEVFDAVEWAAEESRKAGATRLRTQDIAELVVHLERGHGIVVPSAPRRYEFSHNVFREILTGQQLARLEPDELKGLLTDPKWLLPLRYWAGWRAADRQNAGEVFLVAQELLEYGISLDGRPRVVALLAVGEMLVELTYPGSAIRDWQTTQSLRHRIVPLLVALLANPDMDVSLRIRVGDLLGSLGDPRVERLATSPAELVASLVPMKPVGVVTFGRQHPHRVTREKYAQVPSAPPTRGQLDEYAVGVFPVTNLEFSMFIDAAGYHTPRYWKSDEGRKWVSKDEAFISHLRHLVIEGVRLHYQTELLAGRMTADDLQDIADRLVDRSEPLYWNNPRFNHANQPVVGVNLWEAQAYCCWSSEVLAARGLLPPGQEVRLPSEFEWEFAARRGSSDPYPWGSELNVGHLDAHVRDHDLAKIGRTCAVGSFPWARWPDGPLDMVGNVWEWTSSPRGGYPREISMVVPPTDGMAERVARGSSWLSQEPESVEVTFRTFDPPFNAYEDLGFRIVIGRRDG